MAPKLTDGQFAAIRRLYSGQPIYLLANGGVRIEFGSGYFTNRTYEEACRAAEFQLAQEVGRPTQS